MVLKLASVAGALALALLTTRTPTAGAISLRRSDAPAARRRAARSPARVRPTAPAASSASAAPIPVAVEAQFLSPEEKDALKASRRRALLSPQRKLLAVWMGLVLAGSYVNEQCGTVEHARELKAARAEQELYGIVNAAEGNNVRHRPWHQPPRPSSVVIEPKDWFRKFRTLQKEGVESVCYHVRGLGDPASEVPVCETAQHNLDMQYQYHEKSESKKAATLQYFSEGEGVDVGEVDVGVTSVPVAALREYDDYLKSRIDGEVNEGAAEDQKGSSVVSKTQNIVSKQQPCLEYSQACFTERWVQKNGLDNGKYELRGDPESGAVYSLSELLIQNRWPYTSIKHYVEVKCAEGFVTAAGAAAAPEPVCVPLAEREEELREAVTALRMRRKRFLSGEEEDAGGDESASGKKKMCGWLASDEARRVFSALPLPIIPTVGPIINAFMKTVGPMPAWLLTILTALSATTHPFSLVSSDGSKQRAAALQEALALSLLVFLLCIGAARHAKDWAGVQQWADAMFVMFGTGNGDGNGSSSSSFDPSGHTLILYGITLPLLAEVVTEMAHRKGENKAVADALVTAAREGRTESMDGATAAAMPAGQYVTAGKVAKDRLDEKKKVAIWREFIRQFLLVVN